QIARLTGFDGPVIQYSWPSQGKLLSYAVDETNMYWDERNFRRFLQKLATQAWVKEIVIVSHSLGARLVIPAVEYVDRNSSSADSSNISNIILASPDIDRQDFERDITEEVLAARRVNNDRRITVYASLNDKALALSRNIHGYPRLGSPYCFDPFEAASLKAAGLPARCYAAKGRYTEEPSKSGFTIIDTSDASSGGSGHSDYLNSPVVCRDFAAIVNNTRGSIDARLATHLPYVFRLQAEAKRKNQKTYVAETCQRKQRI
ncbi:MAG: alpha/beta hydrolase, partial [Sphingorhabdus sp.]